MKKFNFLKPFCIFSCLYSGAFAVTLLINMIASDNFPMIWVWGLAVNILISFSSICLTSKNDTYHKIIPYIFFAIALLWILWVGNSGIFFMLNGFIYAVWAIFLLNKNKEKLISIACIFTVAVIIYKIILIEFSALVSVPLEISISGMSVDIAMLVYFNSQAADSSDIIGRLDEENIEEMVTSESVITELHFLEFQLEKNYITEEEYNAKRAEFLMNIAKL